MTSSKAGLRYEHELKNDINDNTSREIRAHRPGWSGNGGTQNDDVLTGECDILIRTPNDDHAIEAKKTSNVLTPSNPEPKPFRIPADDISELAHCSNSYTRTWLAMKFNRRKILMAEMSDIEMASESLVESIPAEFAPRTGRKENEHGHYSVILEDPWSLGYKNEWPSSRKADDDYKVILDTLGIKLLSSNNDNFDFNATVEA